MKTKHQRFMSVARALARVSDASDLRVGCVMVCQGRIIASGYNDETTPPALHAEIMAIGLCDPLLLLPTSEMYVTTSPCLACAKRIVTMPGIKTLYYQHDWWDAAASALLQKFGITVIQIKREGHHG